MRIAPGTVAHWERALSVEGSVGGLSPVSQSGSRARALGFLISREWLIGEAAKEGLPVNRQALRARVEGKIGPLSDVDRIERERPPGGRTISDFEFEVRAAMSASMLRSAILSHVPAVTAAEAAVYFRQHRSARRLETRTVDLVERSASRAEALVLASKLGTGRRFDVGAIHETLDKPTPAQEAIAENRALLRAIFAAPIGRMGGPVYYGHWNLFVVRSRQIRPLTFAEAKGGIIERLQQMRERGALAAFERRYQQEWKAKTVCSPGFVVPGCAESSKTPEGEVGLLSGA